MPVGLTAGGVDFGIDQAGANARNANAFACDLVAETGGERIDRAFGGGIIDISVGRT